VRKGQTGRAPLVVGGWPPYTAPMTIERPKNLRRGWTTGACATAATKAALAALWGGAFPDAVRITLPRGETPTFQTAHRARGAGWAEAGVVKDAGDDPDVTHGALIVARVEQAPGGVTFRAGSGVGTVTKPGLPIAVGAAAINPVPRQMMRAVVAGQAAIFGKAGNVAITISVPGGEKLAAKTWNPRLGIVGGLSILGTTGIVRPFSCSAWIASIHRGIDVARASGLRHVAGTTGATSESAVQALYGLADHAMLDMGDFAGGVLKYLRRHPVARLTIGGGIGKMAKLAQGAGDLHSARSTIDFDALGGMARAAGLGDISHANTALEALEIAGPALAEGVANAALAEVQRRLVGVDCLCDIVIINRTGKIIARAGDI